MLPNVPSPLIVIPDPLLRDVDAVLTYAVLEGVVLDTFGPGELDTRALRTAPLEVRAAAQEVAPLLANCLRATCAATPLLGTVALWWGVRMHRASKATRERIAQATQLRQARGTAPLRAVHLLALGDVAFALTSNRPEA